ncbi:hypothetical protein M8542_40490 [Amycolatopsis sp. OK19-0408]|uniref:Uncharacterized protein n=1 Tax=Amycolatopsis iheyensis TaxID=2945988 RepID=A0A9X2NMK0_9PSEU|nr:hypothetical protein [Amycolatopsis iheyensis]MCR6489122.1 hypothetical protein [Amycolatopsis iheyensis]
MSGRFVPGMRRSRTEQWSGRMLAGAGPAVASPGSAKRFVLGRLDLAAVDPGLGGETSRGRAGRVPAGAGSAVAWCQAAGLGPAKRFVPGCLDLAAVGPGLGGETRRGRAGRVPGGAGPAVAR